MKFLKLRRIDNFLVLKYDHVSGVQTSIMITAMKFACFVSFVTVGFIKR